MLTSMQGAGTAAQMMPQYLQGLSQGGQGALSAAQGAAQVAPGGMQIDWQNLAKKGLQQMQRQGYQQQMQQQPPPMIQHAEVSPVASGGLGMPDLTYSAGPQLSDIELARLRRRFGGGF